MKTEMFHGGCHRCSMQEKNGVEYCVGCQFFDADWNLPDLNDARIAESDRINKIKTEARKNISHPKQN